MFVTVCYFNSAEIFLLEPKGGGGGESMGFFYCLIFSYAGYWVSLASHIAQILIHRSTRTFELQSMLKIRDEKIQEEKNKWYI